MKKIIAVAGRKNAGKDVVGEYLEQHGYTRAKFAGALKGMLRWYLAYRGADEVLIERMIEGDLKEVPSAYFEGKTPRHAMQSLGTSWGRDMIGENIWINTLGNHCASIDGPVVITDMRFPNECEAAQDWGAETVRIERSDNDSTDFADHPSENQVDELPVNRIIVNDGTLEDLQTAASILASKR